MNDLRQAAQAIIDAVHSEHCLLEYRDHALIEALENALKSEGIAPPDGYVLVSQNEYLRDKHLNKLVNDCVSAHVAYADSMRRKVTNRQADYKSYINAIAAEKALFAHAKTPYPHAPKPEVKP